MPNLSRDIERRSTEATPLSTLAVLLAGIAALNVASAVLALLAA